TTFSTKSGTLFRSSSASRTSSKVSKKGSSSMFACFASLRISTPIDPRPCDQRDQHFGTQSLRSGEITSNTSFCDITCDARGHLLKNSFPLKSFRGSSGTDNLILLATSKFTKDLRSLINAGQAS